MKKSREKKISAEMFDKKFDRGEDMVEYLDLTQVKVHKTVVRINIDIPKPVLNKIDKEARSIGVARTALIKLWLAERLEHIS